MVTGDYVGTIGLIISGLILVAGIYVSYRVLQSEREEDLSREERIARKKWRRTLDLENKMPIRG